MKPVFGRAGLSTKMGRKTELSMVSTKKYFTQRLRHLKRKMQEKGYDGLVVVDPADVWYLTGFTGGDSVLLLYGGRKMLLTDSRYVEQVRQESPGLPIHVRKKGGITEAAGEVFSRWLTKAKPKQKPAVAVDRNAVTIGLYKQYQKALRKAGAALKLDEGLVKQLRMIKDTLEIKYIRKAARIAEEALSETLEYMETGISEIEIAARLEYEMMRRGGGPIAFESIVAFGGHAAHPHARPGNKKLRKNDTLLFDWGASVNGYRSDLTRCFARGKIRPVFTDVYQALLEAQLTAISTIRAGATLKEVDGAARKTLARRLKDKGRAYPIYAHGSGHGIGLDIHELPFLKPGSTEPLQEGMVITIEPGVYVPGNFGIRIEDDVLVTSRGARVLSRKAKDLSSVLLS